MTFDRAFIKKWSRAAAIGVLGFVATTVAGEFLIALLTEHGVFAHPSATLVGIGRTFVSALDAAWFHWTGGVILGLAAGSFLSDGRLALRAPKPEPEPIPAWVDDPEIKNWRLKVKTLVDFFTSKPDSAIPLASARPFVETLLSDTRDIWLDDRLRRARTDFAERVRDICDRMDDWNKPNWRSDMEMSETMTYLRDAAARLEAGLSGKPVPPAFDPYD